MYRIQVNLLIKVRINLKPFFDLESKSKGNDLPDNTPTDTLNDIPKFSETPTINMDNIQSFTDTPTIDPLNTSVAFSNNEQNDIPTSTNVPSHMPNDIPTSTNAPSHKPSGKPTSTNASCLKPSDEPTSSNETSHDPNNEPTSTNVSYHNTSDNTNNTTSDPDKKETSSLPISKRKPAGRPIGLTKEKKRRESLEDRHAKNNIICNYMWELENANIRHLHKKDIFQHVFEETTRKMNVSKNFSFPYETALSRIRRKNLSGDGKSSPLLPVEFEIVQLLLCMSKLKRSLTASDGLRLINELIDGTSIQDRLIQWKIKKKIFFKDPIDLGRVGLSYWNNFLQRNGHLLKTKVGRKFSVDRSNWSNYLNFRDMYLHIKDVLVNDSKIAIKLPTPVWVDRDGNIVNDEKQAYGCKTDIRIIKPEMAIMFDEVGSNLSQEGDNANGGERYCCGVNEVPYQAASTKNHRFTTMGVTRLDGHPLMCVVIIQGKKRELSVESGIDWDLLDKIDDDYLDNTDDYEFFTDNYGEGKLLPGAPTCEYKGVKVPGYVVFSEGGGIDGEILTTIFRRIDDLKLYHEERKNGFIPFCLLDGHQSRFDLKFLQYINNPETRWNVCIGVPYGTAIWQVGDSSEQNGTFKMKMTDAKKELFNNRLNCFQQSLHLIRTDIISLIGKTWRKAFANPVTNKRAISFRGWDPYTMSLLLEPELRATMTQEMIDWERESNMFPSSVIEQHTDMYYVEEDGRAYLTSIHNHQNDKSEFNFDKGAMAQFVADTVLGAVDRQKSRDRVQKRKSEGETRRNRILKIQKKLTAGKLVLDGRSHHLDHTVLDHVRRKTLEREEEAINKRNKSQLNYLKQCHYADKVWSKNKDLDVSKWKRKDDIITYLKPLKNKDDGKFPSLRKDIERVYNDWIGRNRQNTNDFDDEVKDCFATWLIEQNEDNETENNE